MAATEAAPEVSDGIDPHGSYVQVVPFVRRSGIWFRRWIDGFSEAFSFSHVACFMSMSLPQSRQASHRSTGSNTSHRWMFSHISPPGERQLPSDGPHPTRRPSLFVVGIDGTVVATCSNPMGLWSVRFDRRSRFCLEERRW
mmetsp:Transcript_10150/g.61777  ORF Transcript_10150/g.61777 Transcript_10150/m.61777 type:complete len:141 (+) Transcript_10150:2189-2611(+)